MLELALGIFAREIFLAIFRILTKKDIETELERRGWFRDGIIHSIAYKLKPIIQRCKDIYREELLKTQ